jgi:hypothetical protein
LTPTNGILRSRPVEATSSSSLERHPARACHGITASPPLRPAFARRPGPTRAVRLREAVDYRCHLLGRNADDACDRRDISDEIEGEIVMESRVDGTGLADHKQSVTVRRRMRDYVRVVDSGRESGHGNVDASDSKSPFVWLSEKGSGRPKHSPTNQLQSMVTQLSGKRELSWCATKPCTRKLEGQ